jgi:RHS repeat-associated protein
VLAKGIEATKKRKVGKRKHIALTDASVKPKLASGIFLLYSGDRVFVTRSLVADSLRKNAHRYDELALGALVGEYDGAGNLIQELVWLQDIPVASIRTNENGSGIGVFYIHTDHLNTPRKITRPSDNAIVWRWDSDPFGNGTPNEDPDGNGLFVNFNLRFDGQYFDAETGLNYNYFRDYDPQTGRYVESDPIGLMGGINTYSYARSRPTQLIDPAGTDAMVIIGDRRSDSWNIFGHTSIAITGAGLYSFVTDTPCGASVANFLRTQAQYRNQTVYFVKTSPEQDKKMLQYLQQFGQCKTVPLYPDNCANRTEQALGAGGVPLLDPLTDLFSRGPVSPNPASLDRALGILGATNGVTVTSVSQGSKNFPDASRFEKH